MVVVCGCGYLPDFSERNWVVVGGVMVVMDGYKLFLGIFWMVMGCYESFDGVSRWLWVDGGLEGSRSLWMV